MAKPYDAVILLKTSKTIRILLDELNTEIDVDLDKMLSLDMKMGQRVIVLYDFTTMSVREIRKGFQQDTLWDSNFPEHDRDEDENSNILFFDGEVPHT